MYALVLLSINQHIKSEIGLPSFTHSNDMIAAQN